MRLKNPDGDEVVFLDGAVAQQYRSEINVLEELCGHPDLSLTRRDAAIVKQCSKCGKQVGGAIKKQPEHADLADFDLKLADRCSERRKLDRLEVDRRYWAEELKQAVERRRNAEPVALEYAVYLRSPEWQRKRQKVLKRAHGICEGCLESAATEVHHKSYQWVRDELLFDLVALCAECHRKAHPEHHELEHCYEDFSICSQCRWNGGGIQCLKFDVPTYEALEPKGPCFPPGAALEVLK